MDNSDIVSRHKLLSSRREEIHSIKMKLIAEYEARKRALRTVMGECVKAGFDPNTIDSEIKRIREVLVVKLDIFEADLTEAESQIRPMMKEIG